jgi:hypothetical protein
MGNTCCAADRNKEKEVDKKVSTLSKSLPNKGAKVTASAESTASLKETRILT